MKIPLLSESQVSDLVTTMVGDGLHAKQTKSVAHATVGALYTDRAGIAAIGRSMARRRGVDDKHAIKQFDRLLSNDKIVLANIFEDWVSYVIGPRREIVVALDWTEFHPDAQATVAISIVTRHGRATPLVWLTVPSNSLKNRRAEYEDRVLMMFANAVPANVRVTVLADRAFGDSDLYALLGEGIHFDFVIRFRACIRVQAAEGEERAASEWVPTRGKYRRLRDAKVTARRIPVGAVVVAHDRAMKEPWCLATSRTDDAVTIVKLYGRRFQIEETFRDQKDRRFGLGLYDTRIGDSARRDRMLLVLALATVITTLVGAAGEELGLDKKLKANTSSRRTHSLIRQGREYLAGVRPSQIDRLYRALLKHLQTHGKNGDTFAWI